MENKNNETVLFGLSKTLFWDVDLTKLNSKKLARFVVERVLTYGSWKEFKETLDFYGKEQVAYHASQIRYLDKIVLSFCVTYFKIPKSKFRCYIQKRLHPSHWDY